MVDARFQAQLERLRSDDWLLERARVALEMTAEERLVTAYHLCRLAGETLDRQPPEIIAAVDATHGPPDDSAAAALRRLAAGLPQ
jgi:hypothetical protein